MAWSNQTLLPSYSKLKEAVKKTNRKLKKLNTSSRTAKSKKTGIEKARHFFTSRSQTWGKWKPFKLTCPPKIATASRGVITYNSKVKWTLIENLYSKTQFKTENSNNTLEYVSSNTGEEIFVWSEKCFLPLNKGARDRLTIQEKKMRRIAFKWTWWITIGCCHKRFWPNCEKS